MRILLTESDSVVRERIEVVLSQDRDLQLVGRPSGEDQAFEMALNLRPDVMIIDIDALGLAAADLCKKLQAAQPEIAVVALTSDPTPALALAMLLSGARGILMKGSELAFLRQAIRAIVGGGTFLDPTPARRLVTLLVNTRARGPDGLTGREMLVLALLPKGLSNRGIARYLGLSEYTVRTHLQNAMRKLGVHTRTEAASQAVRRGIA